MRSSLITLVLTIAFLSNTSNVFAENVAPNFSCSASQTLLASDAYSVQCNGDLLVQGGSLVVANSINFNATGTLTLASIFLSAPKISLLGTSVIVGSDVTFETSSFAVETNGNTGELSISPGATISIAGGESIPLAERVAQIGGSVQITPGFLTEIPAIPEPSTYAMMLLGMLGIISCARQRQA